MHATEHSDRFTVVLPNGQPMDVFKADLRPETAAELRSMAVPAMADGDDVSSAELDAIEEQAKELEDARAAQDEVAALSEQVGPPAPPEPMGPPAPAPIVPRGPRALGRDLVVADAATAPAAMFAEQDIPVAGVAPLLDVNAANYPVAPTVPAMSAQQFPGPGAGVPAEFGRVNLIPSFGDAVASVFGGGRGEEAAAPVAPTAPSAPVAPLAPIAPPTDPDAELKARFKAFASGGSRGAPQISVRGVGERAAAPFAMPASYDEAIKQQYDLNERSAKLQADTAAEVERLSTEKGIKEQQMLDRDNAQRAEETRRLDQMREEAFNGKIDVNRAFDRMDGGQRALSLIGLLLGGIGAGNTGVNAAVGVMERMIDRDIDAQAKDLGRKQTAYSNAIQQGYHAEQARQRARLEAMSVLQGSIDRAAMKNGSERALLAGQAANAALSAKVATDTMAMQDKHLERQRQEINSEYDREFKNLTLKAKYDEMRQSREAAALAAWATMHKPDPKLAALEHTLPNGQTVIASDATAKAKLAEAQDAFTSLSDLITDAKANRAKDGRGINPWGATVKDAEAVQGLILGQLNRMLGLGALDVRTMEMLKGFIPRTSDILTNDEGVYASLDRILSTVQTKFLSSVTSNTRGGRVYGLSTQPIGAE